MVTADPRLSDTLRYQGCVSYHWEMNDDTCQRLYEKKAVEEGEIEADPNGPFEKYRPRYSGISWLNHKVLEISDSLGPVTKCLLDQSGMMMVIQRSTVAKMMMRRN
jgi:hypothetical protein